jgi:anti-sigma factor RsiW
MVCKTFEIRILEYVDGTLPAAERAAIESHLAQCAPCQAFARQLRELDTVLASGLKAPALSGEFSLRLRQRIQSAAPEFSEEERWKRKQRLEAEFAAGLVSLRKGVLGIARLLDLLACGAIGAGVGCILLASAPSMAALLNRWMSPDLGQSLLPPMVAGALCLSLGLFIVLRQRYGKAQVG